MLWSLSHPPEGEKIGLAGCPKSRRAGTPACLWGPAAGSGWRRVACRREPGEVWRGEALACVGLGRKGRGASGCRGL